MNIDPATMAVDLTPFKSTTMEEAAEFLSRLDDQQLAELLARAVEKSCKRYTGSIAVTNRS